MISLPIQFSPFSLHGYPMKYGIHGVRVSTDQVFLMSEVKVKLILLNSFFFLLTIGSILSSWSLSANDMTSIPKVRNVPSKKRSIRNIWPGSKNWEAWPDWSVTRTDNIEDPEELAEEISVRPKVVVLEVGVEIVDQQLLLLPLLRLCDDALVKVHLERRDLSGFPVLP